MIDRLDRSRECVPDAVTEGAPTRPAGSTLDLGTIVERLPGSSHEGWFVVEAEQDPKRAPPAGMARVGHKELVRAMQAAVYEVAP